MTRPSISNPDNYEYTIAFGPGTHHELTLRTNGDCWCVVSEPEFGRYSATKYYATHLAPHLDGLTAAVPPPVGDVLRALAAGQTLRQIRKAGIGRYGQDPLKAVAK